MAGAVPFSVNVSDEEEDDDEQDQDVPVVDIRRCETIDCRFEKAAGRKRCMQCLAKQREEGKAAYQRKKQRQTRIVAERDGYLEQLVQAQNAIDHLQRENQQLRRELNKLQGSSS